MGKISWVGVPDSYVQDALDTLNLTYPDDWTNRDDDNSSGGGGGKQTVTTDDMEAWMSSGLNGLKLN
jgi:hypothetical protein